MGWMLIGFVVLVVLQAITVGNLLYHAGYKRGKNDGIALGREQVLKEDIIRIGAIRKRLGSDMEKACIKEPERS